MDLSKFKTTDWLKVGGAAAFVVFGFFDWVTFEYMGFGGEGGNVFDFTWTGTIPWILIVGVGITSFLLVSGSMKPGNLPWGVIHVLAAGLAAVLVLIRLIINPLEGKSEMEALGGDVGVGFGLIVCAIAAVAVAAGSVMAFTAAGGNLKDLTDANKLKAQFGGSQGGPSAPPPPPPGGMAPPPPPPPGG